MFLSNPRKFFLIICISGLILQACGSPSANDDTPLSLTLDANGDFPFSTKEPEVYQADFAITSGQNGSLFFFARKNSKWRYDLMRDGERLVTRLMTDKLYEIDHRNMIFAPSTGIGASAMTNGPSMGNFFGAADYREFEDLGLVGNLRKYKVLEKKSTDDSIFIYIDDVSKMIVKQEFIGKNERPETAMNYIYEVKNLKLNVDDSVFAMPAGYRRVTLNEYRKRTKAPK